MLRSPPPQTDVNTQILFIPRPDRIVGVFFYFGPRMRRILLLILLLVLIAAGIAAWMVLGSGTAFTEKEKTLYISAKAATREAVLDSLRANDIILSEKTFDFLANRLDYWKKIRPGKYDIKKGSSLLTIIRKLRNGQQDPVNLVVTNLRTKEDLARLVGRKFEIDSTAMIRFLNNPDSLQKYETDPEHAFVNILPDTYTYFWDATPSVIYAKFAKTARAFWTEERKKQASALGLTPFQVYTLASIVEEETQNNEEKDTIAAVYLNRLRKNDRLRADPTVKFAVRDFAATRVAGAMLDSDSPYNTYKFPGLPPGPICIPSKRTIEEVLKAPQTDYYYFVANSDFTRSHRFSITFEEHKRKAAEYQEAYRQRYGDSAKKTE